MFIKGEFVKGANKYDAFNGNIFIAVDKDNNKLIFKDTAETEVCSMSFDTEAELVLKLNNICGIG